MALERRKFLLGLFAAPAIVRASNLMPVKLFTLPNEWPIQAYGIQEIIDAAHRGRGCFPNLSEIVTTTLRNRTSVLADEFIFKSK